MGMLSFKEFQATRVARSLTPDELDNMGLSASHAEVFMYDEQCFIICNEDHSFTLIIRFDEWTSMDLEFLERKLFTKWYYEG